MSSNVNTASPTFAEVTAYPFKQPERVFFNPYKNEEMWVSSFGNGMKMGSLIPTGIVTFATEQGEVYPNPTKGSLTLELPRALTQSGDLIVTDLSGRTLMQQKISAGQSTCSLNMSQLPAGRYIIRISNASVLIRESVIVMQ